MTWEVSLGVCVGGRGCGGEEPGFLLLVPETLLLMAGKRGFGGLVHWL